MRHVVTFILFLTCIILVLSIVQVAVTNGISTTGMELDKMSNEIKEYKRENAILSEKLVEHSSLTHIASVAATLGFVEAKSQVFLNSVLPVARR